MLGLPRKTLLAIEAVLDIAYHAGGGTVQSGDITARQGIPRRSLEPILQQLTRAGILTGVRGPKGGYRLARERRRIALGEIIRLVVGEEDTEGSDGELGTRVVVPLWEELTVELMSRLDGISLEDLCERARAAGIHSETAEILDFTI
ncbi:RrF2 family transcriptional regulator [Lacibacterium aquatile]|uniref:RrF2 family transcriptional regulator n=1 Tax=Lacibacterium aquatile TaxID=1168082 RepID=A0ABW5DZB1_9PROT